MIRFIRELRRTDFIVIGILFVALGVSVYLNITCSREAASELEGRTAGG
jgi:hypothetical protein